MEILFLLMKSGHFFDNLYEKGFSKVQKLLQDLSKTYAGVIDFLFDEYWQPFRQLISVNNKLENYRLDLSEYSLDPSDRR